MFNVKLNKKNCLPPTKKKKLSHIIFIIPAENLLRTNLRGALGQQYSFTFFPALYSAHFGAKLVTMATPVYSNTSADENKIKRAINNRTD